MFICQCDCQSFCLHVGLSLHSVSMGDRATHLTPEMFLHNQAVVILHNYRTQFRSNWTTYSSNVAIKT